MDTVAGRDGSVTAHELVITSGPDCGRSMPLVPGRYTIGSSPTCHIVVRDAMLAPHHGILIWNPPHLAVEPLDATDVVTVSDDGCTVRLGSSTCRIRACADIASIPAPGGLFHRVPLGSVDDLSLPVLCDIGPEPESARRPPWGAIITGCTTGVVVAKMAGQWYIAMFSVVTAVVTVVSWSITKVHVASRRRSWVKQSARARAEFDDACHRHAQVLADRRRREYPTLADIHVAVRTGGEWFWAQRALSRVSIGYGVREVTVVPGAPASALEEIPVLVDVAVGTIVGVHGHLAHRAVAAIVARMAARVGPADWSLILVEPDNGTWDFARMLPHCRDTPLDVSDLRDPAPPRIHWVLLASMPSAVASRTSLAMQVMARGNASIIVTGATRRDLPAMCTSIIDSDDEETDGITPATARAMSADISMWIDPDCESVGIPSMVTVHDLSGADDTSVDGIRRRWDQRRGRGPYAIVGIGAHSSVAIDLEIDGPHMVIVGTTGSGKSEVLRSLVLMMAMNNAPDDLTFALVDYKGGSAFDSCAALPHVVGIISDLDTGMAERVLIGLDAEVRRREHVLRSVGARDVQTYHSVRRDGSACLARLVVVIDELAALRHEVPDFLSALVAIAQRGRSLGIHLIVATQRPGNAVSADIMANASIRIALRVQSAADALEVVGTDRPSQVARDRPGRLFIKIGNDPAVEVQSPDVSPVLDAFVHTIRRAADVHGCSAVQRPWTQPLPAELPWPDSRNRHQIGMRDDVHGQSHEPIEIHTNGHILIVGASRSGKSNALRVIARSLLDVDPSVDMYAITCRSSTQILGDTLDVDVGDIERLFRTVSKCHRINDSAQHGRPIVLLVDDVDVWRVQFTEPAHLMVWDMVERLIVDGERLGVRCILSTTREHVLSASVMARIPDVWHGTERSGTFRMVNPTNPSGTCGQLFVTSSIAPHDDTRQRLEAQRVHRLERRVGLRADCQAGCFGLRVETMADARVPAQGGLRLCVIGPTGSGVTGALGELRRAWSEHHGSARIIDGSSDDVDEIVTRLVSDSSCVVYEQPTLIVIDAAHCQVRGESLMRLVTDARFGATVSVFVGATPTLVRSHPDHWVHAVRRSRSGFLLGRSADDDADVLGIHVRPLHIVEMTPGRALWVDAGASLGIVQFFTDV